MAFSKARWDPQRLNARQLGNDFGHDRVEDIVRAAWRHAEADRNVQLADAKFSLATFLLRQKSHHRFIISFDNSNLFV